MRYWVGAAACALAMSGGLVQAPSAAAGQVSAPAPAPAAPAKPEGWSDVSYYLPMRDGVRIAVSLWYPGGKPPAAKAPVLLIQTRYGRAGIYGHNEGGRYEDFRKAGYVVAVIDTRGSTASFGPRDVEMGPDEVRDMDEIITHFKTRPWSNGQVFGAGVSYMADTADLATSSPAGLTGAIVRESDFDTYLDLITPGGVANDFMLNEWGNETLRRDLGRSVDPALGLDCVLRLADCAALYPRMQPVDEDKDFALIRQAIAGRKRWTPQTYAGADFRDDIAHNGYALFGSTSASRMDAIRRQKVPVQYWGSWMDAGTADAALTRFKAAPDVPTQVIITGNNHGGEQSTDPFHPGENPPLPTFDAQVATMQGFLTKVRAGEPVGRSIHYYVLGSGEFRDTAAWPPAGVKVTRYMLGAAGAMAPGKAAEGQDRYAVAFDATTGDATRWTTQIGTPAGYLDRRAADAKLLTYTSQPFTQDMELAGTPQISLTMSAQTADPALFAYLEDVGPDGRVTYLTEGQLRLVNRKLVGEDKLPYPRDAPRHSFNRADALPVVPGQAFEVKMALFPVAALIRKGHSVRIAIAGADAGAFRRYSEGKPDVFTIYRGAASAVDVPLRPWR